MANAKAHVEEILHSNGAGAFADPIDQINLFLRKSKALPFFKSQGRSHAQADQRLQQIVEGELNANGNLRQFEEDLHLKRKADDERAGIEPQTLPAKALQ